MKIEDTREPYKYQFSELGNISNLRIIACHRYQSNCAKGVLQYQFPFLQTEFTDARIKVGRGVQEVSDP